MVLNMEGRGWGGAPGLFCWLERGIYRFPVLKPPNSSTSSFSSESVSREELGLPRIEKLPGETVTSRRVRAVSTSSIFPNRGFE